MSVKRQTWSAVSKDKPRPLSSLREARNRFRQERVPFERESSCERGTQVSPERVLERVQESQIFGSLMDQIYKRVEVVKAFKKVEKVSERKMQPHKERSVEKQGLDLEALVRKVEITTPKMTMKTPQKPKAEKK